MKKKLPGGNEGELNALTMSNASWYMISQAKLLHTIYIPFTLFPIVSLGPISVKLLYTLHQLQRSRRTSCCFLSRENPERPGPSLCKEMEAIFKNGLKQPRGDWELHVNFAPSSGCVV